MIQIIFQREKCIGCNYCIELSPERWKMNKKDGRSLLLGAKNKKGIYSVNVDDIEFEANRASAKVCPMKIIRINKLNK